MLSESMKCEMRIQYSNHAEKRMQQRGIPPLLVDWLYNYGKSLFDNHGAEILFFSKKSSRLLKRDIGSIIYRKIEHLLDCYLIHSNGVVITVGRRYKRLKL